LLLFRLLYYVAPFVLSLLILGGRELLLGLSGRSAGRRLAVDGPAPRPAMGAEPPNSLK